MTRKAGCLEDLAQDFRYACRTLLKSQGFAAVAVLTLALGIGANTAIFSVIDAVLLKPLPFRQPQNIVALWETESSPGSFPLTGPDYLEWRSQNSTFEDMSLYAWQNQYNVSAAGGADSALVVVRTQANFFDLLGVHAQLGRTFAKDEDQNGGSHVVILSNAYWKKHFGGQRDAIGKSLILNSEKYMVIGVLPPWYSVPGRSDLWIPLDMSKDKIGGRGTHQWKALGRLKNGTTPARARADLQVIADRLAKLYPDNNRDVNPIVTPMRDDLVGNFQSQLWILFGAVALVLVIACANVANLLLARATGRRREIAVRTALGAGRGRLVRQLLTESVLLSLLGGVLGVAIAFAGVAALRNLLPPIVPQPNPIAVGIVPLAFTFGTCLVVGILFGLAPAVQSIGVTSAEALKSKGTAGAGAVSRGHWVRNALVTGEMALSLALLIGAGLLLRTFSYLRATDVGVRGEHVLTASVKLPHSKYKTFEQGREFYDQLLQRLQAAPGIQAAAITSKLPLLGGNNGYITIPGQPSDKMTGPLVEFTSMSGDYFRALGIPLLSGREFRPEDLELMAKFMREVIPTKTDEEGMAVAKKYVLPALVNQTMASTFWPKQDAVGKVFEDFVTFQIVGVVGDVKQQTLREPAMPEAYFPLAWDLSEPSRRFSIVVQSAGPPEKVTGAVRSSVQSLDGTLALMAVKTMSQIQQESMTDTQYEAGFLSGMAMLALLLAAVGTYGVMSYIVGQRTNEIGIRMALGAGRGHIVTMVLRQAGTLVGIGIILGLIGAAGGAQLMKALLFGVKPVDATIYANVAVLLTFVALASCYLPVRRAMRVDPMVALRDE
jgi:putative ABC transport system permease protein